MHGLKWSKAENKGKLWVQHCFFQSTVVLSLRGSIQVRMTCWKQKIKHMFEEASVAKEARSSGHVPLLSLLMGDE